MQPRSRTHVGRSATLFVVVFLGVIKFAPVARVKDAPIVARPDLVVPYATKLDDAQPLERPYVADFKRGPFELFYVAALHQADTKSSTCALIRRLFADHSIDALIFEGFPHGERADEPDILRNIRSAEKAGMATESDCAILLARRTNIAFTGGEPDERDIARAVLARGFSARDLLGFYFVRQLPQLYREGCLEKHTVRERYAQYMRSQAPEAGLEAAAEGFTFDRFTEWYRERNGRSFDAAAFDVRRVGGSATQVTAPIADGPCLTQHISAVVGDVRDRFIIGVIAEQLNAHGHVAIVYGGSHLATQRPALDAMLGPAVAQWR